MPQAPATTRWARQHTQPGHREGRGRQPQEGHPEAEGGLPTVTFAGGDGVFVSLGEVEFEAVTSSGGARGCTISECGRQNKQIWHSFCRKKETKSHVC